jgi:hypothetical protein
MTKTSRFRLLAGCWTGFLLILSFLPYREKHRLHTGGALHEVGHVFAFMMLMYLAIKSGRSTGEKASFGVAVLLLGFGVEVGEHIVFHVPTEWSDVRLDSLGAAAGALLARLFT